MKKYSLIFCLLTNLFLSSVFGINEKKLIEQISKCRDDTNKLDLLFQLIEKENGNWFSYNNQLVKLAENLMKSKNPAIQFKAEKYYGFALYNNGIYYQDQNNIFLKVI